GSVVLIARKYVDDVLVVDDGSTDNTVEVATAAGAAVVSHGENMGKGRGVKTSLRYAVEHGFDALVLLDGDGQHDPDEIPQLIEPISNDAADLVIGFRSLGQMPVYRRFGRVVLDHITGAGGSVVTDSQCGFRALNRKAIELLAGKLKKDDFSIESEMTRTAYEQRLRLVEVPINSKYGNFKTSTKNPMSHGVGVLDSVIGLIAEKRPLLYIGLPGFITFLIGVFFGVLLLQEYNQAGYFSLVYAMLVSIFMILGAIGLFMGLTFHVFARLKVIRDK
ncbi:MAG: glycosyltransferase family 2 protein, partial [Methanophagales archaeon]|nr:glycosyltransferase family 2 protein [Methanophagales archaeon]